MRDDTVSEMAKQAQTKVTRARARTMTMVLEGEIGATEMADIGDMLFRLSTTGVQHVVMDLTEVSHVDYRGVRPLIRRAEVFRELGGDIKLAGLSPYVHAIFRSAGANDAFDYFATALDALAFISQGKQLGAMASTEAHAE